MLGLDHADPPLLGDRRRVDGVDLLLGVARHRAAQHLDGEQPGVAVGQPAEEVGLDAIDRGALGDRQRDPDRAERVAQRQVGLEHLEVLGRDGGHVDGARDDATGEGGDDLLGGLKAGAVGRLGGRGAQVRGDDHVAVVKERVLGDRLGAKHVEGGARHLAGVERRLQILVDDERAAGDVEDAHAVLALGQRHRRSASPRCPGSWAGAGSGSRRPRRRRQASRPSRRRARDSARRPRRDRRRSPASESRGRAGRRAGRCDRNRGSPASSRTARCR